MEKKTIGKFISALRKANGMTQKELGEKLFVSDKTVSRWECDECTPELSLIPLIAEIFGITTDELLRGERNNPDRKAESEDIENKQRAKSDKQFKRMLDWNSRKYKNLTLISVGITVLGFITAMIANLGFSKGLIAFCLATAFCVASEICQMCFSINARIIPGEDEDAYLDQVQAANTGIIKSAIAITFVNLLLLAFCLPLVTMIDGANYGLAFGYWLGYGLLYAAIAFVICYLIYTLFVRKILSERGLVVLDEKQQEKIEKDKKLLIKVISIAAAIALALGVCLAVWSVIGWDAILKERRFDSCADFKDFMESDYDRWLEEGYSYIDKNGNIAVEIPVFPGNAIGESKEDKAEEDLYPKRAYEKIYNSQGELICEYYYNPDLYKDIRFTETAEDKMPVTVVTNQAYYNARAVFLAVESILCSLIVIDFVAAVGVYFIKTNKRMQTFA